MAQNFDIFYFEIIIILQTIKWLISANTGNIELNMQKYFVQYFLVLTPKPSNIIIFLYPWLQGIFYVRKPKAYERKKMYHADKVFQFHKWK